jgi:hypothetical protein
MVEVHAVKDLDTVKLITTYSNELTTRNCRRLGCWLESGATDLRLTIHQV